MTYGTTTQQHGVAAVAAARVRDVGGVAYDLTANHVMAQGSWSIPCTAPATFHKPRPRRSQVTSS
jgi:hypothetical protein